MIVEKLKPYVTAFSEELPLRYQHGAEVTVGGKIKKIFKLEDIMSDVLQEKKNKGNIDSKDLGLGIYITLDDGVGILQIVVPKEVYDFVEKAYGLYPSQVVIAHGKLAFLDTTHRYMRNEQEIQVNNHSKEFRVICWEITPLPEA